MKDEIIDKIKKCLIAGYDMNIISQEELNEYWNYITNLQKENEILKDIVVEKDCQLKDMMLQKTDYTAVNILEMKLEYYKSRIDKAKEYINKNKQIESTYKCSVDGNVREFNTYKLYCEPSELLEILGDKE